MTYGQLATARGVKRIAAVRIVQRHKWRKQAGNDGQVRVLVPHDMTGPSNRVPQHVVGDVVGHITGNAVTVTSDTETVLAALREAHGAEIARLTEALAAERARADAVLVRAEAERAEVLVVQAKLAEAEHRLTAAENRYMAAQDQVESYRRAEAERKGRGRWARLRAAWRGK